MRDADIRLRIEEVGDSLRLHLFSKAGDLPLPQVSTPGDLSSLRQEFGSTLDEFKRLVKERLKVSLADGYRALAHLHKVGVVMTMRLLGPAARDLPEVLKLFQDAWPVWDEEPAVAPLLEIESDAARFFPFEIVPLFNWEFPDVPFTSKDQLVRAARSFLGFSMTIKRTLPDRPLASDLKLRAAAGGLPIKFFWYQGLPGARSERDFFISQGGAIDLDGPWPVGVLSRSAVVEQLSRHLFDPGWRLDGMPRTVPDQIHHFACHCDTRAGSSNNYSIELSGGDGRSYGISLLDLEAGVGHLIGTNPTVKASLPLVFMNACGSSEIDPDRFGSFPKLFLSWRNRGFIGTETRVPDEFAAVFSEQFYTNLINGQPVGEALRKAKVTLVETLKNPLGALYTMYADPDLHIEGPDDG
jgi:CHAT domain